MSTKGFRLTTCGLVALAVLSLGIANETVAVAQTKGAKGAKSRAKEGEWPQYRGPNRDNISTETGLLDQWPDDGPALSWKQKGIGEGYSSVVIANGKIFTMGNRSGDEFLIALDASDGKPLWSCKTGKAYSDGTGNGPRGTPTVDGDHVYALGGNGDLVCAKEKDGDIVWQKNILKDFGANNITWGISESPLVDGDKVVCCPGGKGATVVAFNKKTGNGIWKSAVRGDPPASYSSLMPVDFGNDRFYVNYTHSSVIAVRAKDGVVLWGNEASANGTANCSTPLYSNGQIFTSSGYGTGCAMFKLAPGGKVSLGYTNKEMVNHHGGMVVLDGYVYGFDEAVLKCIDIKTGKAMWQNRSVGKGSVTCADGKLFLRSESGPVALAKATTSGYTELGRFDQPDRSRNNSWSHPVVCGGKLYLRDMDTLLVYNVKKE